jgi:hypothetical protein
VKTSSLLVIERILRDRQSIWQQVVQDRDLPRLIGQMLVSSAAALACYGAVLGSFHSFLMALTSALKLPLLFLVTLAICLPTLYLFNLVFGARLSVRQSLALVMTAITVTAMLAVAFAPISLFFLITAPDYSFFKLLNVAILALSALVGLRFLTGGMRVLNEHGLLAPATAAPASTASVGDPVPATVGPAPVAVPEPVPVGAGVAVTNGAATAPGAGVPESASGSIVPGMGGPGAGVPAPAMMIPPGYALQPVADSGHRPLRPLRPLPASQPTPPSMTLLYIWILLFGFVGTQLAWTLRPFFGSPGMAFSLYRDIGGNFYAEILHTISRLF